ncbi:MAG TPA: GAF domain-containing sensor histidine kinase [Anaerolineales bacterium]|nr:GAF domain-containing sensor histidine kinase [Anaerolineales bacterium]
MLAFTPEFIAFVVLLLGVVFYLAVLFSTFRRRSGQELPAILLGLYTLMAMLLQVGEAFWRGGFFPQMDARGFINLEIFGTLFLAFLLVLVARTFLRLEGWIWLAVGVLWALGLAALDSNLLNLPVVIWTNGVVQLKNDGLSLAWAILGWVVFMGGVIGNMLSARKQLRQPLHRNRLSYWLPILIMLIVNDLFVLGGAGIFGNPLRLAATIVMGYVVLTHDLPDARLIMRRALIYIITTLLIVGFYMAGTLGVQPLFRAASNYNPLVTGAAIALLLALLFTPLLGLVQRMVDQLLQIHIMDAGRTLNQYSESISNILDVQRLASVAIGIIIEAMELQRGFLFLVDTETASGGRRIYHLRAARTDGERQILPLLLDENSPIAQHLARDGKTLPQFDLDLLPKFKDITPLEREWFNRLDTEVYAPIFANRRWIGLLALGAKLSTQRFSDADLVTVSALANQTAVALENARLVENLLKLNNQLSQAFRDLDKANHDLERLDQTKSDFISIASHELRTPLTVMRGYTDMLLENRSLDDDIKQVVSFLHKSTVRMHEIMDSMFDIAQIDARALQLHVQPVDSAALVRDVCNGLKKPLADRRLSLTLDLPPLPTVKADPNILRKVFSHLVNNAIKFTPNDGTIRVTGTVAPPNQVDLPNGGVEIIVSDTGVGVDLDFHEMIFTKFYQPGDLGKHSTSKSRFKGGGAGLGLALSKGIVEAHGGRIWVESDGFDEVNLPGSQFHVLLPLAKQEIGNTIPMGGAVSAQLGQPK